MVLGWRPSGDRLTGDPAVGSGGRGKVVLVWCLVSAVVVSALCCRLSLAYVGLACQATSPPSSVTFPRVIVSVSVNVLDFSCKSSGAMDSPHATSVRTLYTEAVSGRATGPHTTLPDTPCIVRLPMAMCCCAAGGLPVAAMSCPSCKGARSGWRLGSSAQHVGP